jgi:hypothetical protein
METTSNSDNKQAKKIAPSTILTWVVIVALAAGLVYFFVENRSLKSPDAQLEIAEAQNKKIVQDVRKIILVPDQDPTIATIVDPEKLREQNAEFYEHAEADDVLLIYPDKAIIYRTADGLIINVAPVTIEPTEEGINAEGGETEQQ